MGPVSEEDNLIPARIVLHDSLLDEGEAVLRRSGNQIKVWSSPEKGAAAEVLTDDSVSEKVWDLTDPDERADFEAVRDNLWIEGYAGSLQPRDVELSFTYRNGDAEGTDTVLVSSIPLELSLFPHESIEIDADDGTINLIAGVYVPTIDDELAPAEDGTEVSWEIVSGLDGYLSESSTFTDDGYALTTLQSSRSAGSEYSVRGAIENVMYDGSHFEVGSFSSVTARMEVVPGSASQIAIEKINKESYAADGVDTIGIKATVEDAFGNSVVDGTPVHWDLEGLGGNGDG